MNRPDLILFAKKPLPGKVKARLQPPCTPERAAEIAAYMIRATVDLAVSFWPSDVYLYGWPDAEHALFRELAETRHVHLDRQAEGDLGEKMHRALCEGIARRGAAAVMGCDVPHCPWDVIEQAHETLARGRPVIGPTEDGGYYLLGLTAPAPALFRGIRWGTNTVLLETAGRAEAAGLEFEWLPRLRDIDTWEDLCAAAEAHAPLRRFVP